MLTFNKIFKVAVSFGLAAATLFGLWSATQTHAQGPPAASPHYFYDRETAFIINYALDPTNGGIYTAVDDDGSLLNSPLPTDVWGFTAGVISGTDKSLIGQATCIRYFITEYQRTQISGVGVGGINGLLNGPNLGSPDDLLLDHARSCADFIINHLEIPPDDAVPEPAGGTGRFPPGADQGDTAAPNLLYYWGFSNQDGNGEFIDDQSGIISAARSESMVAWSLAELGLILAQSGAGSPTPYENAAIRWWDWRTSTALVLPPYNNVNTTPGIGRDVFYAALGSTLTDLTGNPVYRNGTGGPNADGTPNGAFPFADSILSTGTVPDLAFPAPHAFQDGAYIAGLGRGVIFAAHDQQGLGPLTDRDQWWDFGNFPAQAGLDPTTNPNLTDPILSRPFVHTGGREVVAGTQRSLWFFYTFGEDPAIFYAPLFTPTAVVGQAVSDYWQFANVKFWDDTAGQAAWFEALGQPYKPCFAGGTDVPIADWLAPTIAGKVHTPLIPTDAEPVTVAVNNVTDPDWPYLNWNFRGSGIQNVEVAYSVDSGTTWIPLPAVLSGTDYIATIPPQVGGLTVLYYARTQDNFNNWAAFPPSAETWQSNGTSAIDPSQAQSYTVAAAATATPTETPSPPPTDTPVPAATSTPANDDNNNNDNDNNNTSPAIPTITPIPVALVGPPITATATITGTVLPVMTLPETGTQPLSPSLTIGLLALGVLLAVAIIIVNDEL